MLNISTVFNQVTTCCAESYLSIKEFKMGILGASDIWTYCRSFSFMGEGESGTTGGEGTNVGSVMRALKGVMRVGLLAKGLVLRGDRDVRLVVLCHDRPTITLLKRVATDLPVHLAKVKVSPFGVSSVGRPAYRIYMRRLCRAPVTSPSTRSSCSRQRAPCRCPTALSTCWSASLRL